MESGESLLIYVDYVGCSTKLYLLSIVLEPGLKLRGSLKMSKGCYFDIVGLGYIGYNILTEAVPVRFLGMTAKLDIQLRQ